MLDVAAGMATDDTDSVYISSAPGTIDWTTTGDNGMGNGSPLPPDLVPRLRQPRRLAGPLLDESQPAPIARRATRSSRRIGSFLTDGSAHILGFVQDGDVFYWGALPTLQ